MPSSASLGEAVLQAWFSLKPEGFAAQEEAIALRLPQIAAQLFGKAASEDSTIRDLFVGVPDDSDSFSFLSQLHPHAGQVNFLDFWSACGKVSRIVVPIACNGLFHELEALRDGVLSKVEGVRTPRLSSVGVPSNLLLEEMHRVYTESVRPSFWRSAMLALDAFKNVSFCNLHQLTNMFMSWLYESSLWERSKQGSRAAGRCNSAGLLCAPMPLDVLRSSRGASARAPSPQAFRDGQVSPAASMSSTRYTSPSSSRDEQDSPPETSRTPTPPKTPSPTSLINPFAWAFQHKGFPVYLHIYDATREESIQLLNTVLAFEYSPFKFGGAFHTGVEVNGMEWSFGLEDNVSKSGLLCTTPKHHPKHHYRETINCGRTILTEDEIVNIVSQLVEDYPGHDYHVLSRNCCHFADDFCRRLGVAGVPSWAKRFAEIGVQLYSLVPKALKDQIYGLADPRLQQKQVTVGPPYVCENVVAGDVQWDPLQSTLTGSGQKRVSDRLPCQSGDWQKDRYLIPAS